MADKTYRVGIVGVKGRYPPTGTGISTGGPVGPPPPPFKDPVLHSHTNSLSLMPRVDLVAVSDLDPVMLDTFKRNWGHRWPNATPYIDYKEMLSKEGLDVVGVVTGDNTHAGITVDAANAGAKGIFVEKPMATSLEDADLMIKVCEENGTVLQVDHTRRWSPLYHNVRNTVRSGAIGELGTIVATLGGSRAMVFRNGTHMIDSVVFFAESEPAQVLARLEDGFDHWDQYRGDGGKLPENEPGASGLILFRNGVRALYNGTKKTFQAYSLQLSGPEGQIHIDDGGATLKTQAPGTGEVYGRALLPDQYQVHGLVAAYEELISAIESGGQSGSSGYEARKTVQILVGFLKSHQFESKLVNVS